MLQEVLGITRLSTTPEETLTLPQSPGCRNKTCLQQVQVSEGSNIADLLLVNQVSLCLPLTGIRAIVECVYMLAVGTHVSDHFPVMTACWVLKSYTQQFLIMIA